jgi:hypothetical protein
MVGSRQHVRGMGTETTPKSAGTVSERVSAPESGAQSSDELWLFASQLLGRAATPPMAPRPATLFALQRLIGNQAVQSMVASLQRAQAAAAQANKPTPQHATDADRLADDAFVNATVESFPDPELKKQIGTRIKNRRDLLVGMQQYLGTLDDVINHFKQIRKAQVPGDVHVHDLAATRLELALKKLDTEGFPVTSVALGLRDRYHPHTRHGRGLMAHPCGFAIDFYPADNPHITDPRLVKLLAMRTGGATNFDLGKPGQRRSLIRKMGEQTQKGTPEAESPIRDEVDAFRKRLASEFERVSNASKAFSAELGETRAKVMTAYDKLREVDKSLERLRRRKHTRHSGKTSTEPDPEQQNLERQKREIVEQMTPEVLEGAFKPWLDDIDTTTRTIEANIQKVAPGTDPSALPSEPELAKAERLARQAAAAARRMERTTRLSVSGLQHLIAKEKARRATTESQIEHRDARVADLESKLATIQTAISSQSAQKLTADAKLEAIHHQQQVLPDMKELARLESLRKSLTHDPKFVLQGDRPEENPAVAQLLEKGFFNAKDAFNLKFLQTMAEHGFDLGVAWAPGSTDPMHLELVEGVESIRQPAKAAAATPKKPKS